MDFNSLIPALSNSPPSIPYDVTYKICNEEDKVMAEVPGHKMILAMASEVMRNGFFGSDNTDKTAKVIRVQDTTVAAFQTMFDFIYRRAINTDLMKAADIFDVINLAKKYIIQKLEDDFMEKLGKFKVTKDDVIKVAKTAKDYEKFEEASAILMINCANTLNKELKDKETLLEFINKLRATGDEVIGVRLISMMKKTLCSNCQSSPCKSGSPVNISQLRVGTRIRHRNILYGYEEVTAAILEKFFLGDWESFFFLQNYNFFCETWCNDALIYVRDFSEYFWKATILRVPLILSQ